MQLQSHVKASEDSKMVAMNQKCIRNNVCYSLYVLLQRSFNGLTHVLGVRKHNNIVVNAVRRHVKHEIEVGGHLPEVSMEQHIFGVV